MHLRIAVAMAVGLAFLIPLARGDIQSEMVAASQTVQASMPDAQSLLADGRVDDINRKILNTFPEKSRTAVQALVLGNVLFKMDPNTSYALHKRAAAELPDEPLAQLEWAMEQHRAGEFEAAGRSWEKVIHSQPQFGPALGLWAECLIRTGKVREASEAWVRSEQGHGSLEQFESWDCEVHTRAVPDRDRAALLTKTRSGDMDAAARLVALDCNFLRDWWNGGPQQSYLEKDLQVLRSTKFSDPKAAGEAECAAECGLTQAKGDGDVGQVLRKYGILIDDKSTLPRSDHLIAPLLSAALSGQAISDTLARQKLGPAILQRAKSGKDAEVFNAAAHLYLGTDQLLAIDQAGWDATGDPRFAASLLVGLAAKGSLTLEDPRLVKARKQFPENAEIARIVVGLSAKGGKPPQDVLVSAIKAEYSHLSLGGVLEGRPSATSLRAYFSELSKDVNVKVEQGGEPSFQRRAQFLAGNELRVVMETSRRYQPPFSNSAKTADAKGWLITIDLSKPQDASGRAHVYGPLWDVPDPRSSISFEAGANFTKEDADAANATPFDADAANATPFVAFGTDGTLVRLRRDGHGGMTREHLAIDHTGAHWQADGPYTPIANFVGWPSEEQVDTLSRQYHVQANAGKVAVTELLTGKSVADPWLESAFSGYLAIPHFKNVRLFLTDDRKFLVCSPADQWRDGFGADAPLYKDFEFGGGTYSRAEYGLAWWPPSTHATIFQKQQGRGVIVENGPRGAFSIDGRLYLYYEQPTRLRLAPLGGGRPLDTKPPDDPAWQFVPPSAIQHSPQSHRLIFFGDDALTRRPPRPNEDVIVFTWDYKSGSITKAIANTAELFDRKGSLYVPRDAVAVSTQ